MKTYDVALDEFTTTHYRIEAENEASLHDIIDWYQDAASVRDKAKFDKQFRQGSVTQEQIKFIREVTP